jgi:hypothetical protein
VQVRLVRKLAECLDGVDVSRHHAGDVLDLPRREAEMLIAEGWASLEELRRVPEESKSTPGRHDRRRKEDQIREFRDSWSSTVRGWRDEVHSACDTVQRIIRTDDPEAARQQLRPPAAMMPRRGASKGGQGAKLSVKGSGTAKRAEAARWSRPT